MADVTWVDGPTRRFGGSVPCPDNTPAMVTRSLLSVYLGLCFATVHAQEPVLQWGNNFGGINGEGYARIGAVERMADGGIVQGG